MSSKVIQEHLAKVSDVFDVSYGINLELVGLNECKKTDERAIPFVSRIEGNNGVSAYVEKDPEITPNPAHTLSVAAGGSVLSTFYQPVPYYSGRDLYVLAPKKETTPIEMLFFAKCISTNRYKYNYGRQANKTLADLLIPSGIPSSLESSLESLFEEMLNRLSNKAFTDNDLHLDVENWEDFHLTQLFQMKGSKTTPFWTARRNRHWAIPLCDNTGNQQWST